MSFVLTFVPSTCAYKCHAVGCPAATVKVRGTKQTLLEETFDSVADARQWANADETAKAGKPVAAKFKACPCTTVGA